MGRFSRILGMFALVAGLLGSLSGCSTLGYLIQAGRGQLELSNRARPIAEVVRNPKTPERIKSLLNEIGAIKRFGESQGLTATGNYVEYVQLDRPAAVWVVSACRPLEFTAREWNFPLVGSFPYLGWFDHDNAVKYAGELRKEGWDVDVRGASAFSTLGWFRDAVLSSMIASGEEALGELANVILHESVHASVYLNGQSYFNESLANFVADRMTPLFLDQAKGADSMEKLAYIHSEEEDQRKSVALHEAYNNLAALYASAKPAEEKLAIKAGILNELKTRVGTKREINNATLIQFKTYNTGSPEMAKLFSACDGDWRRFLGAIRTLDKSSFKEPQQQDLGPVLSPLLQRGCGRQRG